MIERFQMFIDGRSVNGARGSYGVSNPVRPSERVLEAPWASMEQVDEAVAAARRAFPSWSNAELEERSGLVVDAAKRAAALVTEEGLPALLTREHGKVLAEASFDAGTLDAMAAAFAPLAREALARRTLGQGSRRTEIEHVPHGVIAALLPFNWPVAVMGNKVLPALLTGNTVVVKAPPTCPGAVLAAVGALGEALPPGVLNIVNGPEADLGQALVAHGDVDMVSFTGGVTTGQAVMASAAATTKALVLELGGNDAAVLAPDMVVDDHLADRLVQAAFITSGQVCMAIKRLYVHEAAKAALIEALVARLSAEVVGDGLVEEVTMGPVHLRSAQDRVEGLIDEAASLGARIHRPAEVRRDDVEAGGYLVSPAIVESPPPRARLVVEEQFAPALPVIGYGHLDEGVGAANDTSFGLCASIWSNDDELAQSIARRLEAGTVFVNTHGMSAMDFRAPMGGWKQSGFGVELGAEGMRAFTRPKSVLIQPGQGG